MKNYCLLLVLSLLASAPLSAARKPVTPAGAAYLGAIVTDAENGQVVFEDNADVVSPPASMAKLMTFAVLHDQLASGALKLESPVTINAADSKMGGTQVYLDPRETFPVEELIYAMMIQSANDAAHALARTAAGSVEAFVELMNAKARALGMTNTTFRTPHGLPPSSRRVGDGDLTTPRDFAKLCHYLIQNTDVLKYTSVRERDFGTRRPQGPQHMRNHNNLLGKVAGVDGLKTGYTFGAGYCLSATAARNGRRVIVVIMGSFGPNGQIDKGKTRDLKAIDLIARGFAALPVRTTIKTAAAPAAPAAPIGPTAKTGTKIGVAPTNDDDLLTVKTDKSAVAPAPVPSSTAAEPAITFRVIPPHKTP